MRSALGTYLEAAGKIPLLTPSEEIHLGRQVQAWVKHPDGPDNAPPRIQRIGRRARDRMVTANLRLVVTIAKKRPRGITWTEDQLLERIQNGTLGLVHGVAKFDPERGYKFSTYVYWWIRQRISRAEADNDIIRLPIHVRDEFRSLERAIESIHADGLKISAELIAERSGLTPAKVRERLEIGRVRVVASLDKPFGDSEANLLDVLPSPKTDSLAEYDRQRLRDHLESCIQQLPERDQGLVRIQLDGITLRQYAAEAGISRSRAGQLRSKALAKLKQLAS